MFRTIDYCRQRLAIADPRNICLQLTVADLGPAQLDWLLVSNIGVLDRYGINNHASFYHMVWLLY
jgi:hypothetical protein